MGGKYFFYPDEVHLRKHAHVFFHFTDGSTLVYEDVRKFGTMEVLVPELVDSYFGRKRLVQSRRKRILKGQPSKQPLKNQRNPLNQLF